MIRLSEALARLHLDDQVRYCVFLRQARRGEGGGEGEEGGAVRLRGGEVCRRFFNQLSEEACLRCYYAHVPPDCP